MELLNVTFANYLPTPVTVPQSCTGLVKGMRFCQLSLSNDVKANSYFYISRMQLGTSCKVTFYHIPLLKCNSRCQMNSLFVLGKLTPYCSYCAIVLLLRNAAICPVWFWMGPLTLTAVTSTMIQCFHRATSRIKLFTHWMSCLYPSELL